MVEVSCNDGGDGNQRHGDDDSGEQIKHQPSPENDNAPAATCDGKESKPDKRPVDQHDIITSDNVPLECTTIATSVAVGDPEQTQDGQNRRESAPGICFVPGPDFVSNVASNSYEPAPPEPITETSPPVDNDNYDNVNIMISDVIAIEVDHAVQAEPIETVKYCGKEMHSSSFKCLVCSVLTVAAAVVIIPTALHLNTKNQVSEAGAEAGMLERKPQKKPESFWRETCSVYSNMEGFNNTSSPQSQAVEWILSDTNAIMRGEPKQADFLKDNDRPGLLRERYVLAVLYYSLGGEDWARQEEFMSWDHQCNWNRIKCDERMRVTSIRLENNGLRGTIPREIQHFPILHQLSFKDNPLLSGVVPKELGRLPNLVGLNFQNTSVTGSIDILCQFNYDLVCSLEQEDSMCGFMADLENVDCSCCN